MKRRILKYETENFAHFKRYFNRDILCAFHIYEFHLSTQIIILRIHTSHSFASLRSASRFLWNIFIYFSQRLIFFSFSHRYTNTRTPMPSCSFINFQFGEWLAQKSRCVPLLFSSFVFFLFLTHFGWHVQRLVFVQILLKQVISH